MVGLRDDEAAFLRRALEYLAERVRDHPDDPALASLGHEPGARVLTLIAGIESALADAQDVG